MIITSKRICYNFKYFQKSNVWVYVEINFLRIVQVSGKIRIITVFLVYLVIRMGI